MSERIKERILFPAQIQTVNYYMLLNLKREFLADLFSYNFQINCILVISVVPYIVGFLINISGLAVCASHIHPGTQ